MSPILFHLYGPLAIHSFGVMIVIGLLLTLYMLDKDPLLSKLISSAQLTILIQLGCFAGIVGGRALFVLTNLHLVDSWTFVYKVWAGGLSVLGAVCAIIIAITAYSAYHRLQTIKILDRIAIYAPLLQSIARLGCLSAGCCFGRPTNVSWAIVYTHCESLAPLHVSLHPTQLYSSILCLLLFGFMLMIDKNYRPKRPGILLLWYIVLSCAERFFIDFWRADQEFFIYFDFGLPLSIQQMYALVLGGIAVGTLFFLAIRRYFYESI